MATEFRIARADHVPADAAVGHFDQLDETAQRQLAVAVCDRTLPAVVSVETDALGAFDLVKFTEFLLVEPSVGGEATDGSVVASD